MKEYRKPEVTDISGNVGRAFPAIGLALLGGYVAAKAATSVTKAIFDSNINSPTMAALESVIA